MHEFLKAIIVLAMVSVVFWVVLHFVKEPMFRIVVMGLGAIALLFWVLRYLVPMIPA